MKTEKRGRARERRKEEKRRTMARKRGGEEEGERTRVEKSEEGSEGGKGENVVVSHIYIFK